MAVQADGNIILGGSFSQVNGVNRSRVARLLGDEGSSVPTPVITSAVSVSAQAGQPFALRITATNDPTSYGASGLPQV